jgi:hypothetical protein
MPGRNSEVVGKLKCFDVEGKIILRQIFKE